MYVSKNEMLDSYLNKSILMLENIGYKPHPIQSVTINTQAKTRFGQAQYRSGKYYINIRSDLVDVAFENQESEIWHSGLLQVMLHEVLHCCPNCFCHTGEWKRGANLINKTYGKEYNVCVKRLIPYESVGIEKPKTQDKKYVIECQNCGTTFGYNRKCDWFDELNTCYCGKCGKYALQFTKGYKNKSVNWKIVSVKKG